MNEIDWSRYDGAHGPATETPGILAAIASTDPRSAAEGRYEFCSSLHHEGTVYPATVVAVPFLVELATRHDIHGRGDVVAMIGRLCDRDRTSGESRSQVVAAVSALSEALLPCLDDEELHVRIAAAFTLARSGPQHSAALRARWTTETAPAARASLLLGMALHDPALPTDLLRAALHEPFPVPAAAAYVIARGGASLHADDAATLAAAYEPGEYWHSPWWEDVTGTPRDVLPHLDADSAAILTDALLARPAVPARRGAAIGLAQRFSLPRSAPELLIDRVGRLLADPDSGVREAAVHAAAAAGEAATAITDQLAAAVALSTSDEPAP